MIPELQPETSASVSHCPVPLNVTIAPIVGEQVILLVSALLILVWILAKSTPRRRRW